MKTDKSLKATLALAERHSAAEHERIGTAQRELAELIAMCVAVESPAAERARARKADLLKLLRERTASFDRDVAELRRRIEARNKPAIDNEAHALALFVKNPDWENKEIAERVGVKPAQLSINRYKKFKAARAAHRASHAGRVPRKGTKIDGQIEAIDYD
ncbi:MAG TPA: hypothetical protein VHX65_16850 [Pirellulales bacterium]|jgi:hypothetical protein|nr:hypothetical protein [Pirellulales bacterium]